MAHLIIRTFPSPLSRKPIFRWKPKLPNNLEPDQTASHEVVWSGSKLFVCNLIIICLLVKFGLFFWRGDVENQRARNCLFFVCTSVSFHTVLIRVMNVRFSYTLTRLLLRLKPMRYVPKYTIDIKLSTSYFYWTCINRSDALKRLPYKSTVLITKYTKLPIIDNKFKRALLFQKLKTNALTNFNISRDHERDLLKILLSRNVLMEQNIVNNFVMWLFYPIVVVEKYCPEIRDSEIKRWHIQKIGSMKWISWPL